MSTSQAVIDKFPKKFPFSNRRKTMIPKQYDLGYHVTVLGTYSKKIPKREQSALLEQYHKIQSAAAIRFGTRKHTSRQNRPLVKRRLYAGYLVRGGFRTI